MGGEEEVAGELAEVGGGDGHDAGAHLFEGVNLVVGEETLADGLHLVEGYLVIYGHLAHKLLLRRMELKTRQR